MATGHTDLGASHLKRWVVLCLAAMPLPAQPPATTPTFQAGTNVVEVTAVVRNRDGKAVGGLTADDFLLYDMGKLQTISSFWVKTLADRQPVFVRGMDRETVVTTVLPNRFIAYLLDDQNLVPERLPLAATAGIRHLGDLGPGDRAAVFAASGRLLQPFTADRQKLRAAFGGLVSLDRRETFDISKLNSEITCRITYLKADRISAGDLNALQDCVPRPGSVTPASAVVQRPGAGGTVGATGEYHQIHLSNQVRAFAESIAQAGDRDVRSYFARLTDLIRTMAQMPGERSIILLSPGMYVAPRFRKLQAEVIAEAVRAQVVISAVDPRGVYPRNDPDDPSTWTDAWNIAESAERLGSMEDVTSGTGGRFIRGDNDITGAIRRLETTPEVVYVLGFSPSAQKMDDRFHPLKVELKRSHGLEVTARRGYYAESVTPGPAGKEQRQLAAAYYSGQELHEIDVTLQLRSSHKPGANPLLSANTQIDLAKVRFLPEGAVNRCELTLLVGLFDQDGNPVKDLVKNISLHPNDEELKSLRQSGITVDTDFDVPPGRYLVRALVHDGIGAAMGSQSVGVEIRP